MDMTSPVLFKVWNDEAKKSEFDVSFYISPSAPVTPKATDSGIRIQKMPAQQIYVRLSYGDYLLNSSHNSNIGTFFDTGYLEVWLRMRTGLENTKLCCLSSIIRMNWRCHITIERVTTLLSSLLIEETKFGSSRNLASLPNIPN